MNIPSYLELCTNRAAGHPVINLNLECTRFNIRSVRDDTTWESISCHDRNKARFAVCEYPLSPNNTRKYNLQAGKVKFSRSDLEEVYAAPSDVSIF